MSLDVDGLEVDAGGFRLSAGFCLPLAGITVVFGPSGAGKSILLKTLAGLTRPAAGRIVLGGQVLDDVAGRVHVPPHRRGLGLLFQDSRLFPNLNVQGNLEYPVRRAPLASGDGRARVALAEVARLLEIQDLLPRRVGQLSGGERSRVALARAILGAPRLLMLDEPFAALDGRRRRVFLALLVRLSRELSLPMIVVTHLVEDAIELADTIIAVRAGETIDHGPADRVASGDAFLSLLDQRDYGARIAAQVVSAPGDARGVWVRADSVLLATRRPEGLSARNVWGGHVAKLTREADGSILAVVESAVGRILARVTPEAMDDLGLVAGREVWAVVKTHSL